MSRLAAILFALPILGAQPQMSPMAPREPFVRATGDATVSVKPDEARIQIGVVTQAQTAEAAAGQNANQTTLVLSELRKSLAPGSELQTINYSIAPQYRYPKPGAPPVIDGYAADNTIQVTTRDLASVGKLVDAASKSGANAIRSIAFTVHDDRAVRAQALHDAAGNARANAEAMVSGVGAKLGRLLSIDSSELPRVVPLMQARRAMAADAPATPIEPGSVDVHASVVVSFEITQ